MMHGQKNIKLGQFYLHLIGQTQSVRWLDLWFDDRGIGVRLLVEERDFSLLRNVQIDFGVHAASWSMGIRFPSLAAKRMV
jgi:hypothetical protein